MEAIYISHQLWSSQGSMEICRMEYYAAFKNEFDLHTQRQKDLQNILVSEKIKLKNIVLGMIA